MVKKGATFKAYWKENNDKRKGGKNRAAHLENSGLIEIGSDIGNTLVAEIKVAALGDIIN